MTDEIHLGTAKLIEKLRQRAAQAELEDERQGIMIAVEILEVLAREPMTEAKTAFITPFIDPQHPAFDPVVAFRLMIERPDEFTAAELARVGISTTTGTA